MRVGILTSHPIQYQAPYFRGLAEKIDLHVYFAHRPTPEEQGSGFGRSFQWDVDLLSGYAHTFLKNKARSPGTTHFLGCDTPGIGDLIRTGGFDAFIVSGWFLKSYWQAVGACKRNNVPVLVRGDSQLGTPRSVSKRAMKRLAYRHALNQFDAFLTVGRRNREYLIHYGVPEKKLFSAPHFVDNAWFAVRAAVERPRRREIRAGWGASGDTFVALFGGKFIWQKRISDLIDAIGILNKHGKRFMAVLVGTGELEKQLRRQAELLGANVKFEGFRNQSELPAYYCSVDVFVLPSGSETWGLAVNEAMACGLPAIVSDAVGCTPDLIEEGRTGFSFACGDITDLVQTLEETARLRMLGYDYATALQQKLANYSIENAIAGTITAIKSFARPH